MSIIQNCVKFFEDFIAGDFNENQMISAQIAGGLVSLIPVMDQVMDARDVSGTLYRINKNGGFAKASLEQKIDFGFAAFGVVPEVGSAFKTIFKPVYKQRKAAKGVINGGVLMIERMLGQKKGGAVRWVRALDWASNTQAAIIQANFALDSCIEMLEYMGQSHWWCPDHLQELALDVTPGLKSMRGTLEGPIREASTEIKKVLEELLGEHAAAVALAAVTHAGAMRSVHASTGSNHSHTRQTNGIHKKVGEQARTQVKKARGKIASTVQRIAWAAYELLDRTAQGLIGEHIVDHYVIERKHWGMEWNKHDVLSAAGNGLSEGWQSEHRKINDGGTPTYLCLPSGVVTNQGIDSLWFTNRPRPHQYAVVEAKASINPNKPLYKMLGHAKKKEITESESVPRNSKTRKNKRGGKPLNLQAKEINKKTADKVMQMSRIWVEDRIRKDFFMQSAHMLENYSRHVFFVTPEQAGEHLDALAKIVSSKSIGNPAKAQVYANLHSRHDIKHEFGEADLDQAEQILKNEEKNSSSNK